MSYNFNEEINRKGTMCVKYDNFGGRIKNPNALPMWVADGDITCPRKVVEEIAKRAAHPILGYSYVPEEFYEVTSAWLKKRHGYECQNSWITYSPGVVPALAMAVEAFTKEGEGVIIQSPVYHPFGNTIRDTNRETIKNPLIYKDGKYEIDFEDLEKKASQENAKMLLLCNPHNPSGIVMSEEELIKIGEICDKNGVMIFSDEIHADIILSGNKHVMIASLDRPWAKKIITAHAPSKTFNIAGLCASAVIIEDEEIRERFSHRVKALHLDTPNTFAMTGYIAAYSEGEEYLEELLVHLEGQFDYFKKELEEKTPKIHLIQPQGTYLAWLDCSELGLSGQGVMDFFTFDAEIGVNHGAIFGVEGEQFVRINIACTRKTLEQAIKQLKKAYDNIVY